MARSSFHFRQKNLTPAQQTYYMRVRWPGFSLSRTRNAVTWTGEITPSKTGSTYTVRVTYRHPSRPQVEVLAPKLATRAGKRIPHTFPGEKPCLHLPGEWHGGKVIADTVMHWAAFWLYFYEVWLLTGNWEGGGHEPNLDRKEER